MLSIFLYLLRWSSTLGGSYLPFQVLISHSLSIAALVFLFFFCQFLLLSMLFLTVCLHPFFAHVLPILLPTTYIFRCFFMPISSLNSFIFLLSSWVTLHILRTQLFSAICIFSCLSVSASVPNLYIQVGTTQASNTFPLVVSSVFCPT